MMVTAPKHGHRRPGATTKEYRAWIGMKARVTPGNKDWKNYGARGVSVFPGWAANFEAFLDDVGPAPSKKHSLDRINNDGNYEPGNVRWAVQATQSQNTRVCKYYEYMGERLCIAAWARRFGVCYTKLKRRLKSGLPIEIALSPVDLRKK